MEQPWDDDDGMAFLCEGAEVPADAEELWAETPEGKFRYEILPEGDARLTGYEGITSRLTVPETVEGHPVTVLGRHTFYENGLMLKEIRMPSSLRVIETEAMEFCIYLTYVVLNEGLECIGRNFLNATQVTKIRIPRTVSFIENPGEAAFAFDFEEGNPCYFEQEGGIYFRGEEDGEGIWLAAYQESMDRKGTREKFHVLPGTTGIRSHAFYHAQKISHVTLPESVRSLEDGAFTVSLDPEEAGYSGSAGGPKKRLSVMLEGENPVLSVRRGCLLEKKDADTASNGSAPGSFRLLYAGPEADGDLARLSEELPALLTEIAGEAFWESDVTAVHFPLSLKKIGDHAFTGCHLHEAVLDDPDGGQSVITFPYDYGYLMTQMMEGFGKNGHRYDFASYDEAILEGAWVPEKLRMAVIRLRSRKHLSGDEEKRIRERIEDHLLEIVELLADDHDGSTLSDLAGLHFFQGSVTDEAIALLNGRADRELLPILLNVKHSEKKTAFDFSL